MYAAEKGALDYLYSIQYVCDLAGMENRGPEAQKLNPSGGVPWIEFDDGTAVAETVAICELLEEVGTGRSLLGESMKERATVRMWQRRVEQQIILPSFDAYRWSVFRCYLNLSGAAPSPFQSFRFPCQCDNQRSSNALSSIDRCAFVVAGDQLVISLESGVCTRRSLRRLCCLRSPLDARLSLRISSGGSTASVRAPTLRSDQHQHALTKNRTHLCLIGAWCCSGGGGL
jgi:hypothetical protein